MTSPYNTEDAYKVQYEDGEYSLERSDKSVELTSSGIIHTVLEGETLQNIAYRYYKDSGRWGDIATFNGIINPFDELETHQVLNIPN